jgi:hypothetical protein
MERKHYREGEEPQGRDRHLEVNGLVGTSFTNVEDTLVDMAKCVELYVMNECDCDKLETRDYEEDAKKVNSMKAVKSMQEDNDKLWNHIQESYAKITNSKADVPIDLLYVMDNIVNLRAVAKRAVKAKKEAATRGKPTVSITVEDPTHDSFQAVLDMRLEDVLKAVSKKGQSYKDELKHFVDLVENGSSKDLVAYANKMKEQLHA